MLPKALRAALAASASLVALLCGAGYVHAQAARDPALLFHASGDRSLTADVASGQPAPLFSDKVRIVPNGAQGGAIEAAHDQILAWSAPGNIYAQRGTLAFFWRPREPVGRTEFPLFRVGYADHSSWDMVWLRLDWNGHGFDGFVTDANLARTRVSWRMPSPPRADEWVHLAFAWDETQGVRLFVNGREAARKEAKANYDAGLYAFGPHSRIISPYQVQSRYSFMRGGDIDEIRIYDRMLEPGAVATLAEGRAPSARAAVAADAALEAFRRRHGWAAGAAPPALTAASTTIRKVEFTDARDVKQWNWKGNDGIRETTWPGVYNRSRLPGRNDYFQLPDWNVYSQGGKTVTYSLPAEPWNHIEIAGAAHGRLSASGGGVLATRAAGVERSWHSVPERTGGALRFDNAVQETPIQEIAAYRVAPGAAPKGVAEFSYRLSPGAKPNTPELQSLASFIQGRHPQGERRVALALPAGAPGGAVAEVPSGGDLPLIHVLIPSSFRTTTAGGPMRRFEYGWDGLNAGLDGVALDLPALRLTATHEGRIPLNIRIKDPLWPERDLLDVNVSVEPGQARTLWLDTRDRILPEGRPLYLTVASAAAGFAPESVDGLAVRLVFKEAVAARAEHEHDRFQQVRDNMAFVVEEHPRDRRLALFERLRLDLSDLLRVNPEHEQGRAYWAEINPHQPLPSHVQPTPPAGVPLWAFRQVEDLKRVRRFINWWIDERQAENGEFGGGLSDDTDLLQQWPGLALMGADPDKVKGSLEAMVEAVYANGMFTNGLSTIKTDELHAYEEGINAISEAMYLAYGDPKTVERLMATARAYPRIIERNAAGHVHFNSNYFSGTDVSREGVWEWSKPYSYLVLHPAILLAEFNGSPAMRKMIVDMADGWLAHARPRGAGSLDLPAEINWRTDAERDDLLTTAGGPVALQLFWAAHRYTGDPKYLQPIEQWAAKDPSVLGGINTDLVERLGKGGTWGKALANLPPTNVFAGYQGWRTTGSKAPLEAAYGEEIRTGDRRMYMVTEGHWWSDRVELFSDLLQRTRLGGTALRRNQMVPGHLVSWRFAAPATAESVAALVSPMGTNRFRVVAYNLEQQPVAATMTGWEIPPGRWRMTSGVDSDGDDRIDGAPTTRSVELERSGSLDLTFAPRQTTVLEFELETPGTPYWSRPDLGVGREDVSVRGREAVVVVHSLGGVDAPAGVVTVEDSAGRVVASAPSPALRAPDDLLPKTAAVRLRLPVGFRPAGHRVRVSLPAGPEVTQANNVVALR